MLMILAGAIAACLLGITYLLWNLRNLGKQVENLENRLVMSSRKVMPSLEEVISHYEKKLEEEEDDDEKDEEEINSEEEPSKEEPSHEEPSKEEPSNEEPSHEEYVEKEDSHEEKVIELGKNSEEDNIDTSQFSSVKVKQLKELCKELGFSPKGSKKELIVRLMRHPGLSGPQDIISKLSVEK